MYVLDPIVHIYLAKTLYLTFDQNRNRNWEIEDSKWCFEMFNRNKPEILGSCVTVDEAWLHPWL